MNAPNLRLPRGGAAPRGLAGWLAANLDALNVVDEWLTLRAKGETPWTMRDLLTELRAEHGMGPFGESALRGWLDRHRTELYRRGVRQ